MSSTNKSSIFNLLTDYFSQFAQFERDAKTGDLQKFVIECLQSLGGKAKNVNVAVENLPEEESSAQEDL